jgi:hypothetical protein
MTPRFREGIGTLVYSLGISPAGGNMSERFPRTRGPGGGPAFNSFSIPWDSGTRAAVAISSDTIGPTVFSATAGRGNRSNPDTVDMVF